MPPVGFEPTISAGERPQNYALNRAATGTGIIVIYYTNMAGSSDPQYCGLHRSALGDLRPTSLVETQ